MNRYYSLNPDHSVEPISRDEWIYNLAKQRTVTRTVAQDDVDGTLISTVFLGINHAIDDGPPMIFETMAFGDDDEKFYCMRYSNWKDAEEGHKLAVQFAQAPEGTNWPRAKRKFREV